jgi:hypothetical protein
MQHVARRAIEWRPLVSGSLSKNVTQAQEDEDRQRQEDDGVNIHVAFAFWSAPATGPAVERFHRETAEIKSWSGSAACRHEARPSQWQVLARKALALEIGQAKVLADCHSKIIAHFCSEWKPDHVWKSRIFNNLGPALAVRRSRHRSYRRSQPVAGGALTGHRRFSSLWTEARL